MLALNKTKAALQGRLSHFSNFAKNHTTRIDQVNARGFAHIFSNYGKCPLGVTAAMARFLTELQICNSPHIEGVRHWLIPPVANVETKCVLQRSAATSPNFSGDLQSAENSADTWLAEKPVDSKRWLWFGPQISTKGISSLEQNQSARTHLLGAQSILSWRLIPFSCFLSSCLITSSSEFRLSYFFGMPLFFIISTAASISSDLLNSGGKMLSVSPVIKATLCLHNSAAGQSHEIPTCPATSKTTTSYRSVLLLLSAENLYSMSFISLDKLMSVFFVQPFGSMPRDCSSFLRTRFIQVARDESPSFFISVSSCIRSSCWSRIWYWSVFALSLDIVITKSILSVGGCNYNVTEMVLQLLNTAKPCSARTLSGPLTKPLIEVTVMAGSQHTQTHPKFTWRFLALSASARNVIHITAATEREARDQSPVGCVMVFAGRLPVQGVQHA